MTAIQSLHVFSDGSVETPQPLRRFTVPKRGEFFQILHDFETAEWGHRPRSVVLNYKKDPPLNPLPDTAYLPGCKPADFVPLPSEWQMFWFDLLRLACNKTLSDEELIRRWANLTKDGRAFTDRHAVQNGFRDYIQGLNVGAKPISHKSLSTGGNIVKKIGVDGGKILVEALDLSKPPPRAEDVWGKWYLIHWATQSTVEKLPSGKYRIVRFPQLGSWGTPFPLVSFNGVNKIEPAWTKPIENDSEYSPYVS